MEQGVLALGIQMVRSSAGNEAVVREALGTVAEEKVAAGLHADRVHGAQIFKISLRVRLAQDFLQQRQHRASYAAASS